MNCRFLMATTVAFLSVGLANAQTISSGYDPTAVQKFGVRYRNLSNTGVGDKEVYLGATGTVTLGIADIAGAAPNSQQDITWTTSGTLKFTFDGTLTAKAQVNSNTELANTLAATPIPLNYMQVVLKASGSGRSVTLNNLTVNGNDFGTVQVTNATSLWNITGVLINTSFTVTADYVVGGTLGGGDSGIVEFTAGYVAPSDSTGPITSNVEVDPNPAFLNGSATVSALVDDSTTGGSTIQSAEFQLNGGSWMPMTAPPDGFNAVSETVVGTLSPLTQIGLNTVCVRGTDALNNVGDPSCADFIVTYIFSGFFQPIDNLMVNTAKAGQAVPAMWRLTDADGTGISDPASFVGIFSYPVSCNDWSGSVLDAVEEYASGKSGLQYNGDGYWQYNWKTPKDYANTCRAFYVEFNSGEDSPVVLFQFSK